MSGSPTLDDDPLSVFRALVKGTANEKLLRAIQQLDLSAIADQRLRELADCSSSPRTPLPTTSGLGKSKLRQTAGGGDSDDPSADAPPQKSSKQSDILSNNSAARHAVAATASGIAGRVESTFLAMLVGDAISVPLHWYVPVVLTSPTPEVEELLVMCVGQRTWWWWWWWLRDLGLDHCLPHAPTFNAGLDGAGMWIGCAVRYYDHEALRQHRSEHLARIPGAVDANGNLVSIVAIPGAMRRAHPTSWK